MHTGLLKGSMTREQPQQSKNLIEEPASGIGASYLGGSEGMLSQEILKKGDL